jgi:hypothetical protein
MCSHFFALVVGVLTFLALIPTRALGQEPDYASYNYQRAHRHFVNSPYTFRAFSSLAPGYARSGYTPYGFESTSISPGYERQQIGPYPGQYEFYRAPHYAVRTVILDPPVVYFPPPSGYLYYLPIPAPAPLGQLPDRSRHDNSPISSRHVRQGQSGQHPPIWNNQQLSGRLGTPLWQNLVSGDRSP